MVERGVRVQCEVIRMTRQAIFAAVLALPLVSCVGVYGPKGNDTGGIIPWSPENELNMRDIAQANCARYNKFARITVVTRRYGDYIAYECRWNPRDRRRAG